MSTATVRGIVARALSGMFGLAVPDRGVDRIQVMQIDDQPRRRGVEVVAGRPATLDVRLKHVRLPESVVLDTTAGH